MKPFALPSGAPRIDGMLFASSLHFTAQPETVSRLVPLILPGGSVVIIE